MTLTLFATFASSPQHLLVTLSTFLLGFLRDVGLEVSGDSTGQRLKIQGIAGVDPGFEFLSPHGFIRLPASVELLPLGRCDVAELDVLADTENVTGDGSSTEPLTIIGVNPVTGRHSLG